MIDEIKELEDKYSQRQMFTSRSEMYKQEWETGPDKSLMVEFKPKLTLDFGTAKRALWLIMNATLQKEDKEFYIYEPNKPKLNEIISAVIGHKKGTYLYGRYSSGKTWIMLQLYRMMHQAYYSNQFSDLVSPVWISYKTEIMMRARKEKDISFLNEIFKDKKLIFIDDIGYEYDTQLMLWGNRENVIIHLVDILHRAYLNGAVIHFTSNLQLKHPDPATPCIYKRHGQGTYDRMMEMTTPVLWSGDRNLRTGKIELK